MKKTLAFFTVLIILLTSLTSCSNIEKHATCHPVSYPMSKWAGENIELYIVDPDIMDNPKDLIFVDYGDKKLAYYAQWECNYQVILNICDIREFAFSEKGKTYKNCNGIARWDIELIDKTHCKLINGPKYSEFGLPEEVILTRVATNLTKEDFPQIDIDEQYSFCPTYYYGTNWISDDSQFEVNFDILGFNSNGVGIVNIDSNPEIKYYMYFLESNFSVYVSQKKTALGYLNESDITEHWQCEYFENYFVATVIRSEYYEPGQVITFNRVMPEEDATE